jgi:transposase-like protein
MQRKLARRKFRCSKQECKKECSIRTFTFFAGSALPCSKILYLAFCWINGASWTTAKHMTGHSEHTVTAFYAHFRRLVSGSLEEDDSIIGGSAIEVEIDETKLGKRKYHRGHRVDGVWLIVGVERTENRKVFVVQVEDRSAETLSHAISQHVLSGSVVLTDKWKGYTGLSALGFEHRTVNHSLEFKNPVDGTCTNMVEGTNNALKMKIMPRNRVKEGIENHLSEFVWRRKYAGELWPAFFSALKETHYTFDE